MDFFFSNTNPSPFKIKAEYWLFLFYRSIFLLPVWMSCVLMAPHLQRRFVCGELCIYSPCPCIWSSLLSLLISLHTLLPHLRYGPRLRKSCLSRSSWSAASRKCWRRRTRIGSSPRATSTTRELGSCSSSSMASRSAITTATWRK